MHHTHLCLGADASVHSIGDDCLLNIAYPWEEGDEGSASFGDFQFIKPAKCTQLSADEIDLYDEIAALMSAGRQERCATYRQIQATSHAIASLTQYRYSIDSYVLPPDVRVHPPTQEEFWAVVPGTDLDIACFVVRTTKE